MAGRSGAVEQDSPGLQKETAEQNARVSLDAGETWISIPNAPTAGTFDMAVHSENKDVVLRATGRGVWRSIEAGLSWSVVEELPKRLVASVWFHPKRPNLVLRSSNIYSQDLVTNYSTFFGRRAGSGSGLAAVSGDRRMFVFGGTF